MQAIDVVMLTKNSEHLLDKCLASIYQNVPVNNLIVIDGFSTDRTLKIVDAANERHGNVKVLSVNGSRAKAREKGIAQVSTDWFMFADSDVVLSKDWYRKAQNKHSGRCRGGLGSKHRRHPKPERQTNRQTADYSSHGMLQPARRHPRHVAAARPCI